MEGMQMTEHNWVAFKMSYEETLVFPADHLKAFTEILSNARVLKKGYSDKVAYVAEDIPGFSFITHEAVMGAIARTRMLANQEGENGV
jgi:hypothetical protein